MIDFDQLKRDRDAAMNQLADHLRNGQQCDEEGVICLVSRQACHEAADILARVPDLEALALAGRELAAAAEGMDDVAEHDIDNSGSGWAGMPYGEFKALMDALAAWDKAVKGETND